jgi:TalC/MipB family fructose-6-phosphate aldolase
MKLFIDSADRELVGPLLATGLFAGVTTNPTLLARAGVTVKDLPAFVTWVREAGATTVFVQAWGSSTEDYLSCAARLLDRCGDVEVKVPATPAGVAAACALEADGTRTLLTGVYNHVQVIPAIAAGATHLAPYLGRMTDAGRDGLGEITRMQTIIERTGAATRILVASIRTPGDLATLAAAGVGDFTIAPRLWGEMLAEPLTDAAVAVFDADVRSLLG